MTTPESQVFISYVNEGSSSLRRSIVSDNFFDPDFRTSRHGAIDHFELIEIFEQNIFGSTPLDQSALSPKEVEIVPLRTNSWF